MIEQLDEEINKLKKIIITGWVIQSALFLCIMISTYCAYDNRWRFMNGIFIGVNIMHMFYLILRQSQIKQQMKLFKNMRTIKFLIKLP